MLLAFGVTSSVHAQEQPAQPQSDVPVNTRFGDWIVRCEAVTVTRNVCRVVQEQVLRTDNSLVLRLIGAPVDDGGAVLIAQVPMGVHLPSGAVFRKDGDDAAPQTQMIWQSCYSSVCEAVLVMDEAELSQFEALNTILFGYRMSLDTAPTITQLNTAGFRAGLASLRAANQ